MSSLKSAVKSVSETKLLGLITMLSMMIVSMFIMVVLGFVSTYNNELKVGSIFAELPMGILHGKLKVIPNLIRSGTL